MRRFAFVLLTALVAPQGHVPALVAAPSPKPPLQGLGAPFERHPDLTRWMAFTPPNADLVVAGSAQIVSTAAYRGLKVDVDGRDIAHTAQIGPDSTGVPSILYQNTHYHGRRSNGFGPSVPLSYFVSANTSLDLGVDGANQIHVAWTYEDASSGNALLYYRRKTALLGWEGESVLSPSVPPYVRGTPAVVSYAYSTPIVRGTSASSAHVLAVVRVNYGPSGYDDYVVHWAPGAQPVMVPGTLTTSGIEHLAAATAPAGGLEIFLRESALSAPRHFTQTYVAGNWGTKTAFGYEDVAAYADLAVDVYGNRHYAWGAGGLAYYRMNGDAVQTLLFGQAVGAPKVLVDSRAQVHVLATSAAGLAYAARLRNPDPELVSGAWQVQGISGMPPSGNASELTRAVISKRDLIHATSGTHYTRALDFTLGVRDPAALLSVCPGGELNAISGNLDFRLPFFAAEGVGPTQSLGLQHSTRDPLSSGIAPGWRLNYDIHLVDHWAFVARPGLDAPSDPADMITVFQPDGRPIVFRYNGTLDYHIAEAEHHDFSRIHRLSTSTLSPEYALITKTGDRMDFNAAGKLWRIIDPRANYLELIYDVQGRLTEVWDGLGNGGLGRKTTLTYESFPTHLTPSRLGLVTAPNQTPYRINYQGDELRTVQLSDMVSAPTWGFEYSTTTNPTTRELAGRLRRVLKPRGQAASPKYGWTLKYQADGRLTGVDDPAAPFLLDSDGDATAPVSRVASLEVSYDDTIAGAQTSAGLTWITDRRGFQTKIKHDPGKAVVLEIHDPFALASAPGIGAVLRTFDLAGNLTDVRDRWGHTTTYVYQSTGAVPSFVKDNLIEVWRPKGSGPGQERTASFVYTTDGFNQVAQSTTYATPTLEAAPRARTTKIQYNAYRQPTKVTFPTVVRPDGTVQGALSMLRPEDLAPLLPLLGPSKGQLLGLGRALPSSAGEVALKLTHGGPRGQLTSVTNPEGGTGTYTGFDPEHGFPHSFSLSNVYAPGQASDVTMSYFSGYDTMGKMVDCGRYHVVCGHTYFTNINTPRDPLGRIIKRTYPTGGETDYEYDLDSNLESSSPELGGDTTYTYDPRGVNTSVTSPEGTSSTVPDANGELKRFRDQRGNELNVNLDAFSRPMQFRIPGLTTNCGGGGGPAFHVTNYTYDEWNGTNFTSKMTRVGAPADRVTITTLDNRRRPIRVLYADGQTKTEAFYDEQDQIVATQLLKGSQLQRAQLQFRDARDRVDHVRLQNAAYGSAPTRQADTYTLYNANNRITQLVDPLGDVSDPGYAHKQTFVRDNHDRVTQVIDGKGVVVLENLYYTHGQVWKALVPDPSTKGTERIQHQRYRYDSNLHPTETRDALNNLIRDIHYTDNPGEIDYILTPHDQENATLKTNYTYDSYTRALDEIVSAEGTADETRVKHLWTQGLLTEKRVWSPSAQSYTASYRYTYDQAGRVETYEAPQVAAERYSYNDFGELSQITAGSRVTSFAYNSVGQLTTQTTSGSWSGAISLGYDNAGHTASISDGSRQKETVYDTWRGLPLDEVWKTGGSTWKIQTNEYDLAGNWTGYLDGENKRHEVVYDENNRPIELRYDNTTTFSIAYTPGGLVDYEQWHDASGAAIVRRTHSYDPRGLRIRSRTQRLANAEVVHDLEWEYDFAYRIKKTKLWHLGSEVSYTYDRLNRLISETYTGNSNGQSATPFANTFFTPTGLEGSASAETSTSTHAVTAVPTRTALWTYDRAGNRTGQTVDGQTTSYVYNDASQLTGQVSSSWTISHQYDAWGNETQRTVTGAGARTEAFGYNSLNRLSSYTNSATGATWQYDFWPSGDRFSKTNLTTTQKEIYLPIGANTALDYQQTGAGSITLQNTYSTPGAVDAATTRIPATGGNPARRHYMSDQVGTLDMTLDESGAVAQSVLRDAWGAAISTPSTDRYGFTQREHDGESGLIYMRHRMYDSLSGRFTQTDPLRDNQPNKHYHYASNDPLRRTDPFGLEDGILWGALKKVGNIVKQPFLIAKDAVLATKAAIMGEDYVPENAISRNIYDRMADGQGYGQAVYGWANDTSLNIATFGTNQLFSTGFDMFMLYLCGNYEAADALFKDMASDFIAGAITGAAGKVAGKLLPKGSIGWPKRSSPAGLRASGLPSGGGAYPRTPGLGTHSSMQDLLDSGALPGREGVTITDRHVNFDDLYRMSTKDGRTVEFALTREVVDGKREFRVYSGTDGRVSTPEGSRTIAHTHPPIPGSKPMEVSDLDKAAINAAWEKRSSQDIYARPAPERIIWGLGPDNWQPYYPTVNR